MQLPGMLLKMNRHDFAEGLGGHIFASLNFMLQEQLLTFAQKNTKS